MSKSNSLFRSSTIISVIIGLAAVIYVAFWPIIPYANHKARLVVCRNNHHRLCMGIMMYAQDYDQKTPPTSNWSDGIKSYFKDIQIYVCPEATMLSCGYSFNDRLDRVNINKIAKPQETPLLFDSAGGWNSSCPADQFVARHQNGYICSFTDGHTKWISKY